MKTTQGNNRGSLPVDLSAASPAPGNPALDNPEADNLAADHSKPHRTRPPASVRVREQLEHEARKTRGQTPPESWTGTLPHSAPAVAARKTDAIDPEWLTAHVLKLRSGLVAGSLDQVAAAVHALGEAGLRFDSGLLADHPDAAIFRGLATLRVLQLREPHDARERLAVRLIELGCDPNASDDMDTTVLMHAAKSGMSKLIQTLLADCPELALHRLNFNGRNAAMIAHSNGNQAVLALLESAGAMRNPPNPAISFYEASPERFAGANAESAYQQLWQLLQGTHYMNLADASGKTLIFHAVMNQDVEMVRFLCCRSDYPDLRLRDHDERSVFDYAALIGDEQKRRDIMAELRALRLEIGELGEYRRPPQ